MLHPRSKLTPRDQQNRSVLNWRGLVTHNNRVRTKRSTFRATWSVWIAQSIDYILTEFHIWHWVHVGRRGRHTGSPQPPVRAKRRARRAAALRALPKTCTARQAARQPRHIECSRMLLACAWPFACARGPSLLPTRRCLPSEGCVSIGHATLPRIQTPSCVGCFGFYWFLPPQRVKNR